LLNEIFLLSEAFLFSSNDLLIRMINTPTHHGRSLKVNLPAAKSILSNEILMINLCFALSIYCFPDGEFLNEKKILLNQTSAINLHDHGCLRFFR
jgi:hypothetical protein